MPRMAGHMSAPPIPMRKRAASKVQILGANPPNMEKAAKTAAPIKKVRRRPNMSAIRPPVTMAMPKTMA